MSERKTGFVPVCDTNSRILILGSFPSVKSREIEFYYGHKQNRFWKTVCGYFKETIPETVEGKKNFLSRRQIALWDVVIACEIEGSADASVKDAEIADLNEVFRIANIEKIFLNGTLAYNLFMQQYATIDIPYVKMPSTSPANPRFDPLIWEKEFDDVFTISK
ncbi:MAG: DNA-deoxyinosine glycosylase [Clostridia bacterium]|nr:DNA-deoxyinosine glycosylase [Clostridia bacterium]